MGEDLRVREPLTRNAQVNVEQFLDAATVATDVSGTSFQIQCQPHRDVKIMWYCICRI